MDGKDAIVTIEYMGIRPAPGRCCPDFDCLYGSWDRKTCRGCGRVCDTCRIRGLK